MGTKTTKTKTAAPAKRAAKSKPAAEKVATPEPRRAQPKAAVRKPKATAPRAKKKPSYSEADIALRAYFIAERRQAAGLPGDSHQDWIEAERQLAAEASTARKPKVAQT